MCRIPIRLLKSLLPGTILYETKPPILILVQISGSSPTLLWLPSTQRAWIFLQTATIHWYIQNSQWESVRATIRTQTNKPRIPGIFQTATTSPTCLGPCLSHPRPLWPLLSMLQPPPPLRSWFLNKQICSHTRALTWPSAYLEHFTPDSLHCKQRGQIERVREKGKSKKQTPWRRVRDLRLRRSPVPTQWSKVKEVSLRPKLTSRRLAFCQQDSCEAGSRRNISSFNSSISVSWYVIQNRQK